MLNVVLYRIKLHFIGFIYLCLTSLSNNYNSDLYNLSQIKFVSNYGNLQLFRFKNS